MSGIAAIMFTPEAALHEDTMLATGQSEPGMHTLAKAAKDFPGGGMAGVVFDVDALTALPIQLQYSSRRPFMSVESEDVCRVWCN